jgi:signal transduction histidine kinase
LLVLPTLVLGGLQWHQIVQEKQDELAAVPRTAEDGARRFQEMATGVVQRLIADESRRPFHDYAAFYCPDGALGDDVPLLPSPLVSAPRPSGILCWFVADVTDEERGELQFFWGGAPQDGAPLERELTSATEHLIDNDRDNQRLRRLARLGEFHEQRLTLRSVAANRSRPDDQECLQSMPRYLYENVVELLTSEFSLKLFRDDAGLPHVVATRHVVMDDMPELKGMNECLHRLNRGLGLVQGFFLDPQWMFEALPDSVARTVLDEAQHFVPLGAEQCCEDRQEYNAEIRLIDALGIAVEHEGDRDFGLMYVAVDTQDVEARFRRRSRRFFGMAAMLTLSLGTGMLLLLRSVRRDLEQAERTENFVNAVTHELRTPLSAIKLHSEMLLDGWVSSAEQQKTYYKRIVRETDRLSTMVERVLEKARLAAGKSQPFAGDLGTALREIEPELARWDEREIEDVVFEIEPDLPRVLMTREAIASIVVNLVENARKYAPVDPHDPKAEPIRVVARRDARGRVALEVQDRGPGLSSDEREHVFEAFYRVGNEATRTSRGTGLGLHLVALQAQAIGARAEVEPRPGGGSIFRVTLATPEPES